MTFVNKILGPEANQKLMDKSPCLAPWYFDHSDPKLIKDGKVLTWREIGTHGITSLTDEKGNCYALLGMYCYVLPSDDNKSFLIWNRSLETVNGTQPIRIFYYELDKLQAIVGRDKAISQMEREKRKIHFAVEPIAKIEFVFSPREETMTVDFPEEFKKFREFIFLTELEDLYDNPDPKNYWHNTTMLLINAHSGTVFNYPQDWFNKSDCDFGYQWITRAIKNPGTKLIHGQGIRLSDFVLDKTCRQWVDHI